MSKTRLVKADEGLCRSPYFTHGREYTARQIDDLRVYEVTDDLGRVRVIIPGEPCAHFVMPFPMATRGKFVTVQEG